MVLFQVNGITWHLLLYTIKIELYLLVRSCSDIFPMDDAGFNCLLGEKEERSSSFISLILKNGSGKIFF